MTHSPWLKVGRGRTWLQPRSTLLNMFLAWFRCLKKCVVCEVQTEFIDLQADLRDCQCSLDPEESGPGPCKLTDPFKLSGYPGLTSTFFFNFWVTCFCLYRHDSSRRSASFVFLFNATSYLKCGFDMSRGTLQPSSAVSKVKNCRSYQISIMQM